LQLAAFYLRPTNLRKEPFACWSIGYPAAEPGNRQSHLKAARSNARAVFSLADVRFGSKKRKCGCFGPKSRHSLGAALATELFQFPAYKKGPGRY
jgi:hypothetical protein